MRMLIQLAWRYLWSRRLRSVLTSITLILGVTVIYASLGVAESFRQMFQETQRFSTPADLTITRKSGGFFEVTRIEAIKNVPGVRNVTPMLEYPIAIPDSFVIEKSKKGSVKQLIIHGQKVQAEPEVISSRMISGRRLQLGDRDAIVIHETLSTMSGLGVGDTIRLPASAGITSFNIVGILPPSPVFGEEEVYVPLDAVQNLLNMRGHINAIAVNLKTNANKEDIQRKIMARMGNGFQSGTISGGGDMDAVVERADLVFPIASFVALAMGGFILFNTFRTAFAERKHDIGMLRAVGATRLNVTGILLLEGLLQGIAAVICGVLLGRILTYGEIYFVNSTVAQHINLTMVAPEFSLKHIAITVLMGLGLPLLSGLFPALTTARLSPLEALRPGVPEESSRISRWRARAGVLFIGISLLSFILGNIAVTAVGLFLFIVGTIMLGPALVQPTTRILNRFVARLFKGEARIAASNILRNPFRASITATTIMIGLALMLGVSGFMTTLARGFTRYFDEGIQADYLLMPQKMTLERGNIGADSSLSERLRSTQGIASISTWRKSETQVDGKTLRVIGIDPKTFPKLGGLVFKAGNPANAYAKLTQGRHVVVNGKLAIKNKLKIGDAITFDTLTGHQRYLVAGIGLESMNAKIPVAWISQNNLSLDFHETGDILVMIKREQGADINRLESALKQLTEDYPAFTLVSYENLRKMSVEILTLAARLIYLVMLLVVIPAFLAVTNTLVINVLERTREIGMLRALGVTRSQTGRIIILESMMLSATGTIIAVCAGLWMSYTIAGAVNASGDLMEYYFPWVGVLITIFVGFVMSLVAALIPSRHASRLNIVRALQYE